MEEVKQGYQSLAHSKWDCIHHILFIPKKRRKALFGQVRRHLGEIFHVLERQKECQILEGHLLPDHGKERPKCSPLFPFQHEHQSPS